MSAALEKMYTSLSDILGKALLSGSKHNQISTVAPDGATVNFTKIDKASELSDFVIDGGQSSVTIPDLTDDLEEEEDIMVQSMVTPHNVFSYGDTGSMNIPGNSETVTVSLFSKGKPIPVKRTRKPFTIRIAKVTRS